MEIQQAMRGTAPRAAFVAGQDLPFWYPINAVLTANQAGAKAVIQIDNDADFQWRACIANSTGLFSVLLTNNFIKRPLMPTPINGENIAGTGQQPGFLAVPKRLARTSVIQAEFTDRSGNPNTIQFCLWGYKKFSNAPDSVFIPNVLPYRKAISHVYMPSIEELVQLVGKIPYWWPLFDGSIGAQQAARSKFTVPAGCYATHIVASSAQGAGFALQVFDTESGQIMEDSPAVFPNHAGSAQRPFWLKKVYKLPSDGQIQCRVINLAAVANTVQVVLCGVRD
jgi:hypothetical protein